MHPIEYKPIGLIRSPFKQIDGMPIQPSAAQGSQGQIELFPPYEQGLDDLAGFSHLFLLYHFHRSTGFSLHVKPFLDDQVRGLFSTRAPKRPNPIGLSVVKLLRIDGNILDIENIDMLDETPLLDIKPFIPEMHAVQEYRIGWMTPHAGKLMSQKSDERFK